MHSNLEPAFSDAMGIDDLLNRYLELERKLDELDGRLTKKIQQMLRIAQQSVKVEELRALKEQIDAMDEAIKKGDALAARCHRIIVESLISVFFPKQD